jgi:cell division septal protein FtsQ
MFNKTDYSRRFLNRDFKKRLQQQRDYKRKAATIPETNIAVFLSKLGLNSIKAKIFTALVFFLLVYIIYIPNFLFIKNITVLGVADDTKASVEASINSFLEKKLPWPEKNFLIFSKGQLISYLLKNNSKVFTVNKITKKFPSSITVEVTPRLNQFILENQSIYYYVSNDGRLMESVEKNASGTLPSALGLIKLTSNQSIISGKDLFSAEQVAFFALLANNLEQTARSPVDYYEIEESASQEFKVFLKIGAKLLFSFNTEPGETLTRLNYLLAQYSDADLKNLAYVDMRYQNRGYVCSLSSPCAQETVIPQATTTPTN